MESYIGILFVFTGYLSIDRMPIIVPIHLFCMCYITIHACVLASRNVVVICFCRIVLKEAQYVEKK